jgi:hypothetical protein
MGRDGHVVAVIIERTERQAAAQSSELDSGNISNKIIPEMKSVKRRIETKFWHNIMV